MQTVHVQALRDCLGEGVALTVHGEVLRAVRGALQAASSSSPKSQDACHRNWGLSCAILLSPISAANIHAWSLSERDDDLSNLQTLVSSIACMPCFVGYWI